MLAQQKNQAHDHIEKPDSHYWLSICSILDYIYELCQCFWIIFIIHFWIKDWKKRKIRNAEVHGLFRITKIMFQYEIGEEGEKNKNSLTGGFEPPTFRLTAERSTDWATRARLTVMPNEIRNNVDFLGFFYILH